MRVCLVVLIGILSCLLFVDKANCQKDSEYEYEEYDDIEGGEEISDDESAKDGDVSPSDSEDIIAGDNDSNGDTVIQPNPPKDQAEPPKQTKPKQPSKPKQQKKPKLQNKPSQQNKPRQQNKPKPQSKPNQPSRPKQQSNPRQQANRQTQPKKQQVRPQKRAARAG